MGIGKKRVRVCGNINCSLTTTLAVGGRVAIDQRMEGWTEVGIGNAKYYFCPQHSKERDEKEKSRTIGFEGPRPSGR